MLLLSALPLPVPLPFCVAPAACVSCVSSSLVSNLCCVSSPVSLYSISDISRGSSTPTTNSSTQLPAGSAESLVHNSIHPPLDSLPWWTSSLSPDFLSSWTSSLVAFYTNIHQISYFKPQNFLLNMPAKYILKHIRGGSSFYVRWGFTLSKVGVHIRHIITEGVGGHAPLEKK